MTILLVEQNIHFAKRLGDTVAVMDNGRVVHAGSIPRWQRTRHCSSRCWGCRYEYQAKSPPALIHQAQAAIKRIVNQNRTGRPRMTASDFDWKPLALVPLLALVTLPLVGSPSTWLTLTVAGLAMGMIIFIIASGLTLVFGLMDVLNFGHGVFIRAGRLCGHQRAGRDGRLDGLAELWRNMVAVLPAMLVAMAVAGAWAWRLSASSCGPVYGQHLKQILITMGGMIIGEELIKVIWGPQQIPLPLPGGHARLAAAGRCRHRKVPLVAVAVGLVVFGVLAWTLSRTKVGLLIRAGCRTARWSKALGYRIRRLFVGVFVAARRWRAWAA